MIISLPTLFLWFRRSLAFVVLCTITWLSLTDSSGLRQHEIMHWLVDLHRMTAAPLDKIVHFLMYFAFCGALWMALPVKMFRVPSPMVSFTIASLWGVLMEFSQWLISVLGWGNRTFDVGDMLANACGAFVAALLASALMGFWFGTLALRHCRKWQR